MKCIECGVGFFTEVEQKFYNCKGFYIPKRCKECRDDKKNRYEQIKEEKEIKEFFSTFYLKEINIEEISLTDSNSTLFIIGNGFDLMHGVPSSYYSFRDKIGKSNTLRTTLETYIRTDNVCGNFEDSLAYLDREMMLTTLDQWLSAFDVLDEDDENFSAADFFAAQEATISQVYILTQELPKRFRKWISTLKQQKNSGPLEKLLKDNSRYINFNYTEFLETIYGIPRKNILYIHGDRRDKKSQFVLGHGHDIEEVFEDWYEVNKSREEFQPKLKGRKGKPYNNDNPVYLGCFLKDDSKGNWKSQMRYDAINNIVRLIEDYYDDSAKKTNIVLSDNHMYFKSLEDIKNVIVIGHSLSDVDYPYFKEIIKYNSNTTELKWYISWHSIDSLNKIIKFISEMNIPSANATLFRT